MPDPGLATKGEANETWFVSLGSSYGTASPAFSQALRECFNPPWFVYCFIK